LFLVVKVSVVNKVIPLTISVAAIVPTGDHELTVMLPLSTVYGPVEAL
jgi:hypothetical protein